MWVYAADGQYIEPMKVDALQLFNGDRYSILVELDKPADYYGIRVASIAAAQLVSKLLLVAVTCIRDQRRISGRVLERRIT